MIDLHLTHTGEYHLERLEGLLNSRYQKQFNYDNDDSLKEMIQFASHLQDQDVQREFLLFFLNCGPGIKELLTKDQDGTQFIFFEKN
jgi:hypothetical protein